MMILSTLIMLAGGIYILLARAGVIRLMKTAEAEAEFWRKRGRLMTVCAVIMIVCAVGEAAVAWFRH